VHTNKGKWWGLLALVVLAPAWAADDRPLQVERESTRFVLNADGSFVQEQETAIKVLKDSALEAAKDASVSYSTSIQKAEVVEAYTLKPDGRRVDVPKGNYQVSSSSGREGDSPIYSDQTTLTVVFPELAVGDITVFTYRVTATQPMFPGHFSVIRNYSPAAYYGDVQVTIDAPEAMQATWRNWQMTQPAVQTRDGRRIVRWQWSNRQPVDRESLRDTVFTADRYPGYAFSTFASYADIAAAYGGPANAKAALTPRLRTLAAEIAGKSKDPRETAKKLYEWVSTKITYAGNCIGLGAVVPRDLDVVLDNRMGDCKDHATLLQALLKARGIDSTQALINAGGTYTLPDIPVASVVNHVINYIPSLDLYVDSTAATAPFGSLPDGAAGKPVLLVDGHRDGATTPATQVGSEWQKLRTAIRIQPDGSIKGTQRVELSGRMAVAARSQFRNFGAGDADKLVRNYFRGNALTANGKVTYDDPVPMLETFNMEADFEVDRMIPTTGGFQVQPWFLSFTPVSMLVASQLGDPDQPEGESSCGAYHSDEEYTFEFPALMRIIAVPKDVSLHEGTLSYASTFRQEGARLYVRRTLDDRTPGPVCSPEYNEGFSQVMRKIMPDLRAQVVYLTEEGAVKQ
jgi:transglutaminase-like putative cysteine protease